LKRALDNGIRMQMASAKKLGCRSLRVLPWLVLGWLASCGGAM